MSEPVVIDPGGRLQLISGVERPNRQEYSAVMPRFCQFSSYCVLLGLKSMFLNLQEEEQHTSFITLHQSWAGIVGYPLHLHSHPTVDSICTNNNITLIYRPIGTLHQNRFYTMNYLNHPLIHQNPLFVLYLVIERSQNFLSLKSGNRISKPNKKY